MRNDIESTKRTLLLLREVCVDVGGMFHSIGFKARILESTQEKFLAVVEESCLIATTLQRAFEMHDARALALLREMEEAARPTGTGAAVDVMNDVVTGALVTGALVTDALVTDAVAGMVLAAPTQALSEPAPDRECGPMLAKPLTTAAKA